MVVGVIVLAQVPSMVEVVGVGSACTATRKQYEPHRIGGQI
jgi:hypothetical protein